MDGNKRSRDPVVTIKPRKAHNLDRRDHSGRFEETVIAHLDAAYNLARWLARDERDAEDVVQEACLRAFRFLDSFRGGNARAWFLAIVRNTYFTWLEKNRGRAMHVPFDEESLADVPDGAAHDDVERLLQQQDSKRLVDRALEGLPPEFREVIVLRELEDMSYKEIAQVAAIPLGTVMSRLSRARKLLLSNVLQLTKGN
jgi:RNA polymerase sigma-70 factor (ECF subfamily)